MSSGHGFKNEKKMQVGCGIDVVELSRFRQAMRRGGKAFLRKVFTEQEASYAKSRRRTTLLHLAGRFAAKEAVIKAVSQVAPGRFLAMNQIEICNDSLGRPYVILRDHAIQSSPAFLRKRKNQALQIHISLSHVDTVAVASAFVLKQ